MSTPEQREKNRELSLQQFSAATIEAWALLDAAVDYLPEGETKEDTLQWLKQHLLWGTPETIEECHEWFRRRGIEP